MKIGVFDSGIGGKSVVNAVQKVMPEHQILYAQDAENAPYGTKSPAQLLQFVTPVLQNMANNGAEVIIIACNTVTTTIIKQLRENFSVPIIGIEPMVKPACLLTKSKIIAVCATPTTLSSKRYQELLLEHAKHIRVIEPDCSQWAYMIERNEVDLLHIRQQIETVCKAGADTIVLGCTHYHWIEDDIKKIASTYGAVVIQPEEAVVEQLKRVIARLG